jgi:nitrite reductase/ring-hydroxylating ferredoxin subunit
VKILSRCLKSDEDQDMHLKSNEGQLALDDGKAFFSVTCPLHRSRTQLA